MSNDVKSLNGFYNEDKRASQILDIWVKIVLSVHFHAEISKFNSNCSKYRSRQCYDSKILHNTEVT